MDISVGWIVGGVGSIVGITTIVTNLSDRSARKRKKVYDKIQAIRKESEEKYMSINLCNERSGNMQKNQERIEGKVDEILIEVRRHNGQ